MPALAVAALTLAACGQAAPLPQWTGAVTAAPFVAPSAPPSVEPPSRDQTLPRVAPTSEPAPGTTAAARVTTPPPTGVGGEAFLPTRLIISAIDVDATVVEVGVKDRVLSVPNDPRELGRWSDGARPLDGTGTIVLTGHVDYQGLPGALRPLDELQPGDMATLVGAGGEQSTYVTERVDLLVKKALPYDEIFQYDVPERLVLITCGGTFDRSTGHYDSNVVAFLRLA